eukprot:scaffold23310_cov59-Attheya_sp.AAC.1
MAIAPTVLRTVGEGDAVCATAGDAFRGVSMLIASPICSLCTGVQPTGRLLYVLLLTSRGSLTLRADRIMLAQIYCT